MVEGVVCFLGAGQMAQALAQGWSRSGLVPGARLMAFDPSAEALRLFVERAGAGARAAASGAEAASAADLIVIATKPSHVPAVLAELAAGVPASALAKKLVVSIAAGVTTRTLEAGLKAPCPVVRVMPNTPCLVGRGACCYARGAKATAEHAAVVGRLLSAVGVAHETPEALLDAVTGLAGSGPAFVYTVIEALADGGVQAGLPRALAAELAARTVEGAAEMVLATGEHPATLRDAVTSPAGTTAAGLAELESGAARAALMRAVVAAAERSRELGRS